MEKHRSQIFFSHCILFYYNYSFFLKMMSRKMSIICILLNPFPISKHSIHLQYDNEMILQRNDIFNRRKKEKLKFH